LDAILSHGTLARRIASTLGANPDRSAMQRLYGRLCDCLVENRPFLP
jgi:hypothetical protein